MFICGETGLLLKAELVQENEFFKLYNIYNKQGEFLYKTTEPKERKTEKDNHAIIYGFETPITEEEKKSELGHIRVNRKLTKCQVRKARDMFEKGFTRKQIATELNRPYELIVKLIGGFTYTEIK